MVVGGQRHVSAALSQRKRPVSIAQEAGSAPVTDLTDAEKRIYLAPIWVQNPKRPNYYSDAFPTSVDRRQRVKSKTMRSAQNVAHVVFKGQ